MPHAVAPLLAPSGVLRATINLGNPILANEGPDGQPVGISVDMVHALSEQLGVPLQLQVLKSAGEAVQAVTAQEADIGFFAIDPVRGKGLHFTSPYLLIEGAYLVRQGSPIHDNTQVDRPGIRVAVGKGSAYDLYLTRELNNAEIVRAPTSPGVVDMFLAEGLEVAAGVRQQLQADAARVPGLRLLPGRFMVIQQAMGMPNVRSPEALQFLAEFVEAQKASGFVEAAMVRHGIRGASVAPAA